jgi:cytochrome c oxidase cbb3-type subunit 1
MWVSGVTQGLMWRAVNADGSLAYTFIETVAAIRVYDVIRVGGGAIFLFGALLMLFNVSMTIRQGSAAIPAPDLPRGAAAAVAGGK